MVRIGIGTVIDESFDLSYHAAKSAGLPIGAYYYFQPEQENPADAVKLVTTEVESTGYAFDLPVMLDLESFPDGNPGGVHDWVNAFLESASSIAGAAILYANPTQTSGKVSGSLAQWSTCQARYPFYGSSGCTKRPPSSLADWAAWMPWDKSPAPTSVLSEWSAWQFAPCGNWAEYCKPGDTAMQDVDVNIVKHDAWLTWQNPQSARPVPESPAGAARTTYVVKAGDSPWLIAERKLGDGTRYGELAAANGHGTDPDNWMIHPGESLIIPD